MEERDVCVRKDFSSIREGKRIPIICNLINELWQRYRMSDPTIGFYYITNLLEVEAKKANNGDPFYWEEDKWYDKIQDLIEHSKNFKKNYELPPEDIKEMSLIVSYFEGYWFMYQDLRLQQLLNIFDELFEEKIRGWEVLGIGDWNYILIGEQCKILQDKITSLNNTKKEIIDGASSLFNLGLVGSDVQDLKKIYVTKIDEEINSCKEKYELLKKEYDDIL